MSPVHCVVQAPRALLHKSSCLCRSSSRLPWVPIRGGEPDTTAPSRRGRNPAGVWWGLDPRQPRTGRPRWPARPPQGGCPSPSLVRSSRSRSIPGGSGDSGLTPLKRKLGRRGTDEQAASTYGSRLAWVRAVDLGALELFWAKRITYFVVVKTTKYVTFKCFSAYFYWYENNYFFKNKKISALSSLMASTRGRN